jgi:hypothetical protein
VRAGNVDQDLHDALDAAVARCRQTMADYRAGIVDAAELRNLLFRAGFVRRSDQAWLLDLRTSRWWRYNGIGIGPDDTPLTEADVAWLRDFVDELTNEPPEDAARDTRASRGSEDR